jgi:hypothetical protein
MTLSSLFWRFEGLSDGRFQHDNVAWRKLEAVHPSQAHPRALPRFSFSRGAHEAGAWDVGSSGPPVVYSVVKSRAAKAAKSE